MPILELREVRDTLPEQHRYEADAYLVHQAEGECLLRHVRTGDRDVLVAGDLFRSIDRRLDTVDERRCRPSFGGIRRRAMSDHDDGCAGGVLVVPTISDVEQVPPGDDGAGVLVRYRNTSALASSTLNETSSLGFGTVTSPASDHSNSSPTWSSGCAMYPSNDIVMWLRTLPIVGLPSDNDRPGHCRALRDVPMMVVRPPDQRSELCGSRPSFVSNDAPAPGTLNSGFAWPYAPSVDCRMRKRSASIVLRGGAVR